MLFLCNISLPTVPLEIYKLLRNIRLTSETLLTFSANELSQRAESVYAEYCSLKLQVKLNQPKANVLSNLQIYLLLRIPVVYWNWVCHKRMNHFNESDQFLSLGGIKIYHYKDPNEYSEYGKVSLKSVQEEWQRAFYSGICLWKDCTCVQEHRFHLLL